jgi:hypothetical protein
MWQYLQETNATSFHILLPRHLPLDILVNIASNKESYGFRKN